MCINKKKFQGVTKRSKRLTTVINPRMVKAYFITVGILVLILYAQLGVMF